MEIEFTDDFQPITADNLSNDHSSGGGAEQVKRNIASFYEDSPHGNKRVEISPAKESNFSKEVADQEKPVFNGDSSSNGCDLDLGKGRDFDEDDDQLQDQGYLTVSNL